MLSSLMLYARTTRSCVIVNPLTPTAVSGTVAVRRGTCGIEDTVTVKVLQTLIGAYVEGRRNVRHVY